MVHPLQSKEATLVEINEALFGIFDPLDGSVRVEIVEGPIDTTPVSVTPLFSTRGPHPLQSEEISFSKLNDVMAGVFTPGGFLNTTLE